MGARWLEGEGEIPGGQEGVADTAGPEADVGVEEGVEVEVKEDEADERLKTGVEELGDTEEVGANVAGRARVGGELEVCTIVLLLPLAFEGD